MGDGFTSPNGYFILWQRKLFLCLWSYFESALEIWRYFCNLSMWLHLKHWLLWSVFLSYLWIVVILLWEIITFLFVAVDRCCCHSDLWNKLSTQNVYYTCFWNMMDINNSILLHCDAASLDNQIPLFQRDVLPFFFHDLLTQFLITSWCIVMSQNCCENLKSHMMDTTLILEFLCLNILCLLPTANWFYNVQPFKW